VKADNGLQKKHNYINNMNTETSSMQI